MPQSPASSPGEPPRIVLDTNVVLDWLYFRDRRCASLAEAIAARRVRWIASPAMHSEIEHVIERGSLGDKWPEGSASVLDGWQRWATMVRADDRPSLSRMRCTDPDDQKFIDLAMQIGAGTLLSADRAVLRLARHGRALGLEIATVERWTRRVA